VYLGWFDRSIWPTRVLCQPMSVFAIRGGQPSDCVELRSLLSFEYLDFFQRNKRDSDILKDRETRTAKIVLFLVYGFSSLFSSFFERN
jgi:hypothetical protein